MRFIQSFSDLQKLNDEGVDGFDLSEHVNSQATGVHTYPGPPTAAELIPEAKTSLVNKTWTCPIDCQYVSRN